MPQNSKQIVDDIIMRIAIPIDASRKKQATCTGGATIATTGTSNANDTHDIFAASLKRLRPLSECDSYSLELNDGSPHHHQCRRRLSSIAKSNSNEYFAPKERHSLSHFKEVLDEIDAEDAIERKQQQQQQQQQEDEGENKAGKAKPRSSICWAGKKESHFFAYGHFLNLLIDDDDSDGDSDDES